MVIDFLIQSIAAALFLLGMVGIGFALLRVFRFQGGNAFFDSGVAYFVSLCLYVMGAVLVLFAFPWKILSLQIFTVSYLLVSYLLLFRGFRERYSEIVPIMHRNKEFLAVGFLAVLLFFFQIYHTSILDEWLHRPVVRSFTENGIFPLVNPLDPHGGYIYTYHYGTQIISSAVQVITKIGVSESMDVFKLSYFMAAFVLFYGMLSKWIGGKREAAFGAFLVLFAGSSFFLLDAFSVSHIWRLKWIESEWPLNVPPAYTLSGITWINIVLSVAFVLLLDHVLKNSKKEAFWQLALLGVLFSGFFLISEIFALLIFGIFFIFFLWKILRESKRKLKSFLLVGTLFVIIFSGIYATGGIVGHFANDAVLSVRKLVSSDAAAPASIETTPAQQIVSEKAPPATQSLLLFRSPEHWGYPAENKILTVVGYPFLYVRNFLLEISIFVLLACLAYRKKVKLFGYPIFSSVVVVGFLLPFFFSTSYGTLNLTKLTVFSLMVLHLVGFTLLFKMGLKKSILIPMLTLFIFAAIPGALIGTNMQWKWISGKGKEQACSQNPICYKGEFTDLLRKFEQEYPGLKKISVDPKNAKKVADLTTSYVYSYDLFSGFSAHPDIEYIVYTPELRKSLLKVDESEFLHLEPLMQQGEYTIYLIGKE